MSDYTQVTDYSTKDALASGDAAKKILGSEIDAELSAIATAIASKLNSSGGTDLAVADGGTGASTAAGARTNLGLGSMSTQDASAVAITGGTIAGISALTVTSTDAGASIAPDLILDRNSASPAANDVIGSVQFKGRDSGGNVTDYARIGSTITDPTNGSEDGILTLQTSVAGTLATRATITAGIQVGSPTGGDKGAGTINAASSIYVNDVAALTSAGWQSYTPTVTLAGGSGNVVPVYSTNVGRYFQAGNIIFVFVRLSGDGGAEGAGTGTLTINLPATPSASVEQGFSPVGFMVNGATFNTVLGDITASTLTMALRSNSGALTGADQNDASRSITLRFFYET